MAKKMNVVVSQGQSASPAKRGLEGDLVTALLLEPNVEVTVVPHLYDLASDGTGVLAMTGIHGDMIVASWMYPRAAHWTLARNGIRGSMGKTLLADETQDEEDEDEEEPQASGEEEGDGENGNGRVAASGDLPNRTIYHLDLRSRDSAEPFLEEIRRIVAEASVETVPLMNWIGGTPKSDQLQRYLAPRGQVAGGNGDSAKDDATDGDQQHAVAPIAAGEAPDGNGNVQTAATGAPQLVEEQTARRWYPVIDFSRCTNCLECIDFCLFGVYGVDRAETILVEQPDNCRKGCPACSRVCPENAIIFPQHKAPAIAGSPVEGGGGFKIDLSKLFGAPDALSVAVDERDQELVAAGRGAVGDAVGMPKRQANKESTERDELDNLIDQLDELDL